MLINELPKEIQSKVTAFLKAVDVCFVFLNDYGYIIKEKRIAKQYVVKNIIEVLYQNDELERVVLIYYQPNDIDGNEYNYISVSIYNEIKSFNKKLLLELYIKKYKPELDVKQLTYPNQNNKLTFEENILTCVSGFAYFLSDAGINLINGSEWEDGLIFDWSSAEKILYEEQKKLISGDNRDKPKP